MAIVLALTGASAAKAATDDTYIGYADPWRYGVDPGDITVADEFRSFLFVAPGGTYAGVERRQVPLEGERVVYCFNAWKKYPPSVSELNGDNIAGDSALDPNTEPLWTHSFGNLASWAITPRNEQTIEQDTLRVIYNGYDGQGHDRAGLQAALGLTDAQFYQATQRALWYFTDSREITSDTDLVAQAARILAGVESHSEVNPQDPAEGTLELWQSNQPGRAEDRDTIGYQHLLGARFVDPVTGEEIPEEPETPENPAPSTVTVTETPSTTATETTTVTATTTPTVTETTTETKTESTEVPTTVTETESTEVPTTVTETSQVTTTETAPCPTVTETTQVTTTETAPCPTVTVTETPTPAEPSEPNRDGGITVTEREDGSLIVIDKDRENTVEKIIERQTPP